jgi:hypothetical protein
MLFGQMRLQAMTSSDLAVWIQTVVIVVSFGLAYRQFIRWREEILGGKQIDLAIEIGKAASRIREAYRPARFPDIFIPKDRNLASSPEEEERRVRAFDADQRISIVREPMGELERLLWEASILFEVEVEKKLNIYFNSYKSLYKRFYEAAIDSYLNGHRQKPDMRKILRAPNSIFDEEDKFADEISKVTDDILDLIKKSIKPSKKTPYDPSADWRNAS